MLHHHRAVAIVVSTASSARLRHLYLTVDAAQAPEYVRAVTVAFRDQPDPPTTTAIEIQWPLRCRPTRR